ncbi:transcriptional regulator MalT [Variibacter gotjawalensis]|uniref:Transcriptional regulator MalT n=1 Tax=Variibacter gotjawalensis TaxID=1333996 RepID=A0A0S3PNU3_9BRAD|nr:helix-turn-helix transcriptional regulator [Variibacter gotjawalensis]NIK47839.1 DNA-binding CsgD family transcriptional regulator [Variibacter gotjawalensis]RZS49727.1 DNA-binding CsgD family transcriptional regulator [Variibacter gotjawalensis]BAT57555.1 transcriptional regulator MalT [Variibacter gotjawalensis]
MERDPLDLIYGAIADPAAWPLVLTQLADYFGAIGGLMAHINLTPGRESGVVITGRLSTEADRKFAEEHVDNPMSRAMSVAAPERVVQLGRQVDMAALKRTQFHADVLDPQSIADILSFTHPALNIRDGIGGFSFMFSESQRDRIGANMERLQHLVPHLGRALDASLKLAPMMDGTRQLERVLQAMPNPSLVLDGQGRLLLANKAAEPLFEVHVGSLRLDKNRRVYANTTLPAEASEFARSLDMALAVASSSGDKLSPPVRLTRLVGSPLLVIPVPLPQPAFAMWHLLGLARVLLLVIDPTGPTKSQAALLQAAFQLTAAEARVAIMIASGMSGPQVADALKVSPATVKTHLSRCFEKTGVHSQVSLARMVSALPVDDLEPALGKLF